MNRHYNPTEEKVIDQLREFHIVDGQFIQDGQEHEQRIFKFENGYGASVVRGPWTYGGKDGLFELAVLDSNGDLCYTTPVTNDVIGSLTEDEVQDYLDKIAAL